MHQISLQPIDYPDLIQKSQTKYPKDFNRLKLLTIAVAAFAATAFIAVGATLLIGAMGIGGIGVISILVAAPFVFAFSAFIIKKIDDKTHFWSAKIGEITYLLAVKKKCDAALKLTPSNQAPDINVLMKRAAASCQLVIHGHVKELGAIKRDLDTILKIDPNHQKVQLLLAEFYRLTKEPEKALLILDPAIHADPQNYYALLTRAEIYRSIGKGQEALTDFTAVIALNARDPYAKKALVELSCSSRFQQIGYGLKNWVSIRSIPCRVHLLS